MIVPLDQVVNDVVKEVRFILNDRAHIRIYSDPYQLLTQEAALIMVKAMEPPATVEELNIVHHGREELPSG